MTKLLEWLSVAAIFGVVWIALLADIGPIQTTAKMKDFLIPLPVYILIVIACYSFGYVGYGVMTFNDCVDANKSLRMEVAEATKDLMKQGLEL